MENNETLVTEEAVTENTEQTAEETPKEKTYTQDEVNAIVGKRIARTEAKIRKEYRGHDDLVKTLETGTGTHGVSELNEAFRNFYASKNIEIPQREDPDNVRDTEILARADAEEIIRCGDEEAADEFRRLETLGTKMTPREKATFKVLAEHLQTAEAERKLAEIGVGEEVFHSREFRDFASKFSRKTPITDVYNIYQQTKPKKEIKTMGSMKNSDSADDVVKDFYTPEEARRFSNADYDRIPGLFDAVKKSMTKWR